MRIALKVDVDTYRGTLEGVPALLRIFDRFDVRATFLFSLGPDHTGRAIRRIFRPGFLSKVRRTSVASHYGFKTLMYGVLLPGPHIGRRCAGILRDVESAGHEVGIHCYDHVRWQDYVVHKNMNWTRREMEKAQDVFREVYGRPATVIGAAGWQINQHALELEQEMGFEYASDVRGDEPFYPRLASGVSRCLQIPTTLPTLDEIIGRDGITARNAHETILRDSRKSLIHGHVYTLHAELEGMQLAEPLERMLQVWRDFGASVGTLGDTVRSLDRKNVVVRSVQLGVVPGRSGMLAVAGTNAES